MRPEEIPVRQPDPIVAEVRKVRHEIETQCNNDMHTLFLRALAVEQKFAPHVTPENIFVFRAS